MHLRIPMLLAVLLLAGCDDPAHRKVLERREGNLARTSNQLMEMEEGRTDKMERTLSIAGEQHQRDLQKSGENPGKVGEMVQEDVDRWKENQPAYAEEIENQLKGDPKNIERTVPHVVY